jgi:hypothetical protein
MAGKVASGPGKSNDPSGVKAGSASGGVRLNGMQPAGGGNSAGQGKGDVRQNGIQAGSGTGAAGSDRTTYFPEYAGGAHVKIKPSKGSIR